VQCGQYVPPNMTTEGFPSNSDNVDVSVITEAVVFGKVHPTKKGANKSTRSVFFIKK